MADLERIRLHLTDTPAPETGLGQRDYLGAACVFLLVFSCTFPVVLPFLVWQDPRVALTVSNSVAIAMLFLTRYTLGRQSGRPWVVGLSMVALGLSLVMSKVHIVKCDHNGDQFFNRTEMACVGGIYHQMYVAN